MFSAKKNEKKGFVFEGWNLGEARLAIKYCLTRKVNLLSLDEILFLEKLQERIKAITELTRQIQTLELPNNPDDYTLETMIQAYKNRLKEAIEVIYSAVKHNISDYLKKNVPLNKSASPYFLELMQNIETCCAGVLSSLEQMEIKLQKEMFLLTRVCKNAEKLAGVSIPMSQDFDPLQGLINTSLVPPTEGNCFGHVYFWAKQVHEKGYANPSIVLDTYAYKRHKDQEERRAKLPNISIPPMANSQFITDLLQKINNQGVYELELYSKTGGHAIGIRKIPKTGEIEFFDPNFGLFLFKNEKSFRDFFMRLMTSYRLRGDDYRTATLKCISEQPANAKSCLSAFEVKGDYIVTAEEFKKTIFTFNHFFNQQKTEGFKIMTPDRFKEIFLEVFPSYIDYVQDPEEIELIKKQLKNLTFLAMADHGKDEIDNSQPGNPKMPPNVNGTEKKLIDILDEKQSELVSTNKLNLSSL